MDLLISLILLIIANQTWKIAEEMKKVSKELHWANSLKQEEICNGIAEKD